MAQRRMFSLKIVASDAFLDMPASSRELYFQLGMYADDDGFINPRKIMRMVGASDDDLKVLLGKRFLLSFENGVIVIKHWKINNLVRKDFYQPTLYSEEKKRLEIKENGAYTDCKQNVNILLSQYSIGKDSIGNMNTLEKITKKKAKRLSSDVDFEAFWKEYPKKAGSKSKALGYWEDNVGDNKNLISEIMTHLKNRKEKTDWTKQNCKFVVYPERFLRDKRWNDEIVVENVREIINLNKK